MAAADTTTADSISGLGETLQNLISINKAGFAGIESSLRSEFRGQNKLLGGYLGKNLQLIAEALTDSNDDLIKQMQADARAAAEAAAEALRGAGGGDDAGGVEATDASIQWNPVTILAATAGFLIGFFQGFFGPVGALMKAWGKAVKSFFGKPLKWGWTKFSDMLKNSKIGAWYRSVKGWFQHKAWDGKFKWAQFKDMLAKSKIGVWFTSVKAWFGAKTGMILPKIKTLWANSAIGKGIKAIKGLFGGGVKIPGIGAVDDVLLKVKNLFGPGGPFKVFMTIGRAFGKIFFFMNIFFAMFDFYSGFVETEGNLLDKILGGLKAAFVGFFGGFMDLGIMLEDGIKWIIKKIAGFFGFDEEEVAASMEGFSIFKPLKQMVTDIADWFVGLFDFSSFSAGLISAAKLLFLPITALLDLTGFIWDWFMGLFGWKDENAPKDERTLTTKLGDLLIGVWDWFAGLFSWGADKKPADDGQTVLGKLGDLLKGAWDWFLNLFGFGGGHSAEMPADDGQTVMGKLGDLLLGVWKWFKGLFGFGEGGGATTPISVDSVTMTLANLLVGAWSWFKGLFGFSSPEEDADTAKGVGGFLKDLVDGVWGYFKKLFKFGSIGDVMKSYFNLLTFFPNIIKDAIAGVTSWLLGLFGFDEAAKTVANAQNFSLGDMLFNAIEAIWDWFKELLNFDVMGMIKKIPGGEMLMNLFGAGKADKATESLKALGIKQATMDVGSWDIMDQEKQIRAAAKGMDAAGLAKMASAITAVGAEGDLVTSDQKKVMNLLAELQREKQALQGSGGTTTIIQDNSQNQSNSSQPLVLPTPAITPGNGGTVLQQ